MGTDLAVRTEKTVEMIRDPDFEAQVRAALPAGVGVERFVRAAVTTMREADPKVIAADRSSLFSALIKSATDGLLPDGNEAALVAFKDKERGQVAVYLPMIGGLRKIAAEYGWTIRTAIVCANDHFEYSLGLDPVLVHKPTKLGSDPGPMVGAYAVARHLDGRLEFEVMTKDEIQKVQKTSRAAGYGPWVDWPDRMWEKTVGRRLFKKLPLVSPYDSALERVRSVADSGEEFAPAEALYGPDSVAPQAAERRPPASAIPPAEPGPTGADDDLAEVVVEGGEPEPTDNRSGFAAPSSVADDDEVKAADEAGAVKFEAGRHAGKTIREVYDLGDEGASYIGWACRNYKPEMTVGRAVREFAAVYAPDAVPEQKEEA